MATAPKKRKSAKRRRPSIRERAKRHGQTAAEQKQYVDYATMCDAAKRKVYGKNADIRRRGAKDLQRMAGG